MKTIYAISDAMGNVYPFTNCSNAEGAWFKHLFKDGYPQYCLEQEFKNAKEKSEKDGDKLVEIEIK